MRAHDILYPVREGQRMGVHRTGEKADLGKEAVRLEQGGHTPNRPNIDLLTPLSSCCPFNPR